MIPKKLFPLLLAILCLCTAVPGLRAGVEIDGPVRWGSGPYLDVAVSGSLGVLAAGEAGIELFDLSDPANPQPRGVAKSAGSTRFVTISGGLAYISGYGSGDTGGSRVIFTIVDPSRPEAPELLGHLEFPETNPGEIVISGDYALLATYGSFQILDISNPHSPRQTGACRLRIGGRELAVRDRYAYVVSLFKRLQVIDWSDPANPVEIGAYEGPEYLHDIVLEGDIAFLGTKTGLLVLDLGDPTAPVKIATLDLDRECTRLAAGPAERQLLLADDQGGLNTIDISDPAHPVAIAHFAGAGPVAGLAAGAGGNYLLAEAEQGLETIAATGNGNFAQLARYDHSGRLYRCARHGDYLFATNPDGVKIIATTSPYRECGYLETGHRVAGLAVAGDYLYLTGKTMTTTKPQPRLSMRS